MFRERAVLTLAISLAAVAASAGDHQRPDPPVKPAAVSSDLSAFEAAVRSRETVGREWRVGTSAHLPQATVSFPYAVIRDKATNEVVGPVLELVRFGGNFPPFVNSGLMAYPLTANEAVLIPFDAVFGTNDVTFPFNGRIWLPTTDCTGSQFYIQATWMGLQLSSRFWTTASSTPTSFMSMFAADINAVPSQVTVRSAVSRGNCEHYNPAIMINAVPATLVFSMFPGRHPDGLQFSAP
jgi:hypothetical protein